MSPETLELDKTLMITRERDQNVEMNRSELGERKIELTTTPRLVTLGTHNSCNAKCVFCLEGQYPRFDLKMYKEFFEGRMGRYIKQAEKVTFTGFGEVLWVPDAVPFLDYVNETIPETWKIFTTNGTPLRPEIMERILKSKYVIQVSLHASHAKLHEELTLLPGAYSQIIDSVGYLCRERRERKIGDRLHLVMVNVVTNKNVDDLPNLIQLAWDLKIPEVQCNYVTMFNQDHFEMSPFFQQERANKAIDAAQAKLDEIRSKADPDEFRYFGVRLPQKFGQPSSGKAEGFCSEPWEHIYVEGQGSVLPCCNWGAHVGNLNKGEELDDIWNGAFYKTMREAISKNEPHPWCGTCWKYRPQSVDSLLGHITNRPDQQKRLLRQLEERGLAKYSDYAAGIEAAEGFMPR